jgi:hypothetical protein
MSKRKPTEPGDEEMEGKPLENKEPVNPSSDLPDLPSWSPPYTDEQPSEEQEPVPEAVGEAPKSYEDLAERITGESKGFSSLGGNGHTNGVRGKVSIATRILSNRLPGTVLFERKSIYFIRGLKEPLDPAVADSLEALQKESQEGADDTRRYIAQRGLSDEIQSVTDRLNGAGLEDIPRLLLSTENIYAAVLRKVLRDDRVKANDTLGMVSAIKRNAETVRSEFLARIVEYVLLRRNIELPEDRLQRLFDRVERNGVALRQGKTGPAIVALLNDLEREGDIPAYIEQYASRKELPEKALTALVRKYMGDYLLKVGIVFKDQAAIDAGEYDEYFALAYNYALERAAGADDPIDAANTRGAVTEWDFTLDTFDNFDDQVVIPTNIKAAGALYYNYYIGEVMRVYAIADALVLRWASAALDIPDGQTAAALYRYYKKREDRATPEERGMLYKRIFKMGDAQMLSRMVVNESFEGLWYRLMSEVSEYIRKQEENSSSSGRISRTPIFQATKELQYNLTEHMTGMAHLQVAEMHAHLKEAIDLLKSEDVIDHFGGRRKNMFRVIERIAAEDMGITIPTSLIRTIAVEGANILQNWVATFDQQTYTEDQFLGLLTSGEAWIIDEASREHDGEEDEEEEFDSEIEDKEDFNDWES